MLVLALLHSLALDVLLDLLVGRVTLGSRGVLGRGGRLGGEGVVARKSGEGGGDRARGRTEGKRAESGCDACEHCAVLGCALMEEEFVSGTVGDG